MCTHMNDADPKPNLTGPPMGGDDVVDDFPFPTEGRLAVLYAILDGTLDPYDTKSIRRMERIANMAGRMSKGN
jgi:hypothetical protein